MPRKLPSSAGKSSPPVSGNGLLTRERIAEHMAAFKQQGGKVEVLGHTPLRKDKPGAK